MKNSFNAKENPSISDVKSFWDSNPLWTGESKHKPGTLEFFEEHRNVVIKDCFAGELDSKTLPPFEISDSNDKTILDLGCGVGFWTSEFARKGYKNLFAADLTKNAITITKKD